MPGGPDFNTRGLVNSTGVLPLDSLTINDSVTVPHSHNISDRGSSDSSTARASNLVGATHFSASPSRAHHDGSGARTPDYFNDAPFIPLRAGQCLPQAYLTHYRAHGISSYPIPAESHRGVDSNRSSSRASSSDQDQLYASHSQHQQYSGTSIYYNPTARPSYQSDSINLTPEFYEQPSRDLPQPTHSSQAHIGQSSASSLSSHRSLSTFSAAPTSNKRSRHLLFEDAGPYLRETLCIPLCKEINLWALSDPPKGEKPNQPYPILIKLAVYGSPHQQLTLQEIYKALEDRFKWFDDRRSEKAWKNSIRHSLSLNKVFKHVPRAITETGKGSYWQLDCSCGEGYKRPRKRRSKSARAALEQGDDDNSLLEGGDVVGMNLPQAGMPAGSSHASICPSPMAGASDNFCIDPELRRGSHIVGEGQTRSASHRPTTSPYQRKTCAIL
ncbi:hypothetical protein BDR05DRAFT_1063661 [Suillus weaverae]|nr:hypothetical protein BDR05DRAFT_1063661 [Suillus weaverae]